MTERYAAYALALELKCPDVDVMLASMSIKGFLEWQAFFRIRAERERGPQTAGGPPPGSGDSGMHARLVGAFTGYQERRDHQNGN